MKWSDPVSRNILKHLVDGQVTRLAMSAARYIQKAVLNVFLSFQKDSIWNTGGGFHYKDKTFASIDYINSLKSDVQSR